ncbi:hypothetical protein [uncultured Sphingomonas sp.]|uniref:hypothetical protein n=1 Tax=uncultured Sphingomonas sp. TaxID=158754 RepID=UPI0025E4C8B2|nr:hypothetical protein [uncultured Sphingomonas sp.]
MDDIEKRKRKLLKLPSIENWARNNRPRFDDTFFALSNFDRNPPRFGLAVVKGLCASMAKGELSLNDALDKSDEIKHDAVRASAQQVLPAFSRYLFRRPVEGLGAFDGFSLSYPIGPRPGGGTLAIPVAPTFVGLRGGALVPIFIIPWANFALDGFQKQLISSVLKDALLSHQDFIGCDGEVLAFPKNDGESTRYERSWNITSYASMDREDLNRQFGIFGRALFKVIEEMETQSG